MAHQESDSGVLVWAKAHQPQKEGPALRILREWTPLPPFSSLFLNNRISFFAQWDPFPRPSRCSKRHTHRSRWSVPRQPDRARLPQWRTKGASRSTLPESIPVFGYILALHGPVWGVISRNRKNDSPLSGFLVGTNAARRAYICISGIVRGNSCILFCEG